MNVLVTGSEGFIGPAVMEALIGAGHYVVGLDTCFYTAELVPYERKHSLIVKDIRDVTAEELQGFDAIVHLAALSNDPLGELNPQLTFDINQIATARLAELAKAAGVQRFIFSSSCSVYGQTNLARPVAEGAETNPLTIYADSKLGAECELLALAGDGFEPVILRNATAYGISPHQRLDLVLPNLAVYAYLEDRVLLKSDGKACRPVVHIQDIARAVLKAIKAPSKDVAGSIFNVGHVLCNHSITDIAKAVADAFVCPIAFAEDKPSADARSYRVDFLKAQHLLGLECSWDIERGAKQFARVLPHAKLTAAIFAGPEFNRLKRIRQLIAEERVNSDLRWCFNA